MNKFIVTPDSDFNAVRKATYSGKHCIYTNNPQRYLNVDFVDYVRDKETFADKEYKKWLAERR